MERWEKKFKKNPFSKLIKEDKKLSKIRKKFKLESKSERRFSADMEYNSGLTSSVFNEALLGAGGEPFEDMSGWPSYFTALAIDPEYAPAILTVGSVEYQLGRTEEAMKLFLSLTKLSKDEKDLEEIIDKAGDSLLDNEDYKNALALYTTVEKVFPTNALFCNSSGFCLAKLGHLNESVEKLRIAVKLEPDNYQYLNDLGFVLLEAGNLNEAEKYLRKSISLSPNDYELPRNNLKDLLKPRI